MKLSFAILGVLALGLLTVAIGADERAAGDKPAQKPAEKKKAKAAVEAADKPAAKPEAEGKDSEKSASVWMRKKLDYSQNILAGITSGDFELVAQNANAMKSLGKIEVFVRGRTPGYKSQMQVFQEANDELLRQAQKESADGAALAFTQLTISCINCHKHLREQEGK